MIFFLLGLTHRGKKYDLGLHFPYCSVLTGKISTTSKPCPNLSIQLFSSFFSLSTKAHLEYKIIPDLNHKKSSSLKRVERRFFLREWAIILVLQESQGFKRDNLKSDGPPEVEADISHPGGGWVPPAPLAGLLPKCHMGPEAGQSYKDPLTPPHIQIGSCARW